MDDQTRQVYDTQAATFSAHMRRIEPRTLYTLVRAFFHPGQPTIDVGCGSGRDVAWLQANGYPARGYDGSAGMLRAARLAYPGIEAREDDLPDLTTVPDAAFVNALCSAVLMHLPREDVIAAALTLARVLRPGGRLILTYRPGQTDGDREDDGRLFTPLPQGRLLLLLEAAGFQVLVATRQPDTDRPAVLWTTIVAEKSPLPVARGLDRIQGILAQDRKVATYKLALVRALCAVSRTEAHSVRWGDGVVSVPLWALAVRWLTYYWPFITPTFIAQRRGECPDAPRPLAFRGAIRDLAARFGHNGLYAVLRDLEEQPMRYHGVLKKIADTIRAGPVIHAGTGGPAVFGFSARPGAGDPDPLQGTFGYVVVPEPVWLDISRFDHWIEDSVIMRWAQLTAEMNPAGSIGAYLPLLLATPGDPRETTEVRRLIGAEGAPWECVWTGRALDSRFEVDHAIPYSVWGNNNLWNLLPCLARVNRAKSDALPTRQLLVRRRDAIVRYWGLYESQWGMRFTRQMHGSLGSMVGQRGWERQGLTGLEEAVERLATTRGLARWEP